MSSLPVTTRLGTPGDAGVLQTLYSHYVTERQLRNDASQLSELVRYLLSSPGVGVIVAEVSGEVTAFLSYGMTSATTIAGPALSLADVWVAPTYRRHGVARELFEHAERLARQTNCRSIDFISSINKKDLVTVYKSLGWDAEQCYFWRREL